MNDAKRRMNEWMNEWMNDAYITSRSEQQPQKKSKMHYTVIQKSQSMIHSSSESNSYINQGAKRLWLAQFLNDWNPSSLITPTTVWEFIPSFDCSMDSSPISRYMKKSLWVNVNWLHCSFQLVLRHCHLQELVQHQQVVPEVMPQPFIFPDLLCFFLTPVASNTCMS